MFKLVGDVCELSLLSILWEEAADYTQKVLCFGRYEHKIKRIKKFYEMRFFLSMPTIISWGK